MTDKDIDAKEVARGDDPFPVGLFGGSPKTAIDPCSRSMNATTRHIVIGTDVCDVSFVGRAKRSSSAPKSRRRYSFGENSSTPAANAESTAPCFATKARTSQASLSDRLTRSLIESGLVKGITPMSIRQMSGQPIQALAFDTPDGGDAGEPEAGSSCLNASATPSPLR